MAEIKKYLLIDNDGDGVELLSLKELKGRFALWEKEYNSGDWDGVQGLIDDGQLKVFEIVKEIQIEIHSRTEVLIDV